MSVAIHIGDCRDVLRTLRGESVHCVVTSPPYWGLRDYGTAKWEGGDAGCAHINGRPGSWRADGIVQTVSQRNRDGAGAFSGNCSKCGAIRIDAQLGLEPDFHDYVVAMVEVFRDVRRVLRKDGTLWLNLGDSYSSGERATYGTWAPDSKQATHTAIKSAKRPPAQDALKPKDLCGIPWRVAFALQEDGWYLRQDIIWSKPNPMPESVTDRCTKAHEYLFLLAKSERYYYDAEAIAEQSATEPHSPGNASKRFEKQGTHSWELERMNAVWGANGKRNRRSVWEVTTQPFSEAHFATFPPALIEPCIKAGCPVGGTVLDPFAGAGTTGLVADRLQRNAILIELNPQYGEMSERRITGDAPLFTDVMREEYDPTDDVSKSFEEAYRAIRERIRTGGPGWTPK